MNILVVAAHPDDEVLGAGATIARHAKAGDKVSVLISPVTRSRGAADAQSHRALRHQTETAARILGVDSLNFANFPDNRMDTVALLDVVKAIEGVAARLNPETVYTHCARDLNVDHEVAARAVATAFRPQPGLSQCRCQCSPQRDPARRRGRLDRGAPLRRRHLRALLPVPDGGGAADAAAAAPGAADRGRAPAAARRRGRAWLVTRQVITPGAAGPSCRRADRVGRLEERMHVSGEDDIARLATSFNQMAEALQSQIRKLVELSRVQRTFVSDVSHELRTPLTTVRMAGDVLHDARGELRPGDRARGRAVAERARPVREPARRPARDQPVRRGRGRARARGHQPRRRRPPRGRRRRRRWRSSGESAGDRPRRRRVHGRGRRTPGRADRAQPGDQRDRPRRLQRRDACGSPPTARPPRSTVRDHGVGLQPGQSAMVFNRFWRADPARARTTGGTGLGLAIALEDARLHGGWLQAWGTPGGGAQFRLTLPRRAGDPLTPQPAAAGAARRPRRASHERAGGHAGARRRSW